MTTKKSVTHKAVSDKTTPEEVENGSSKPSATVTDAQQFPRLEKDAHAEHRIARHVERDGHVIAQVEVPAHTAEVSLGSSRIEGCALAAAEAWDAIDKAPDDADFAHSTKLHRQDLINHAEEVFYVRHCLTRRYHYGEI